MGLSAARGGLGEHRYPLDTCVHLTHNALLNRATQARSAEVLCQDLDDGGYRGHACEVLRCRVQQYNGAE